MYQQKKCRQKMNLFWQMIKERDASVWSSLCLELIRVCSAGVQQQAAKYVKCNFDNFVSVSVTTSPIWQIENEFCIIYHQHQTEHSAHRTREMMDSYYVLSNICIDSLSESIFWHNHNLQPSTLILQFLSFSACFKR